MRWRVSWSASTNADFEGYGEWHETDPSWTEEQVEDFVYGHINQGEGEPSKGLVFVLLESGLEWSLEFEHIVNTDHPKHGRAPTKEES